MSGRNFVSMLALVFLAGLASRAKAGDAAPTTLVLHSEPPRHGKPHTMDQSLLVRELARQAVLIAARDELHLQTRDLTLREPFKADGAIELDLHTTVVPDKSLTIELAPHDGQTIWTAVVPLKTFQPKPELATQWGLVRQPDYEALAARLEPLSRGAMVDALRKAGFTALKPTTEPVTPDDFERFLGELSIVSQFQAVRAAHGAATPEAGEALVRGYANLGRLTLENWNATAKDFIARSLLYAERLVAADPKSPRPLWHRAYARAMAGFHVDALDDVARARTMAGNLIPPAWVALIEPLCHYNTGALLDAATGQKQKDVASLAGYLGFATMEHTKSVVYLVQLGRASLELNPFCQPVADAIAAGCGVGPGAEFNAAQHEMIAAMLVVHRKFLPDSAQAAIPGQAPNPDLTMTFPARLADRLLKEGESDTAEPSWGLLARLVHEADFLAVLRMMTYQIWGLGVDTDDYLRAAMPLIADHPYRAYIESLPIANTSQLRRTEELLRQLQLEDIELTELQVLYKFGVSGKPSNVPGESWFSLLSTRQDMIDRDLYQWTQRYRGVNAASLRREFSPDCTWAVAQLVRNAWNNVGPHAAEWEAQYGGQPDVRAAFADAYKKLNRPDDAIRNLKAYLKKAPDMSAYADLSEQYFAEKKYDEGLAALNESLTKQEYGLSRANAHVRIATYYMWKKDYQAALPHAEEAAQSWAEWAMKTAVSCYTGLGRWDEAEQWLQRSAERYDDPYTWYEWCLRTGHGHRDQAAAAVRAWAQRGNLGANVYYLATFYLQEGDPARALPILRDDFARRHNIYSGLLAANIMDAQGDTAGRDEMLKTIAEMPADMKKGDPRPMLLARKMRQALADGLDEKTPRDKADLFPDELKDRAGIARYIAGSFLYQHGQAALAKEYWLHCFNGYDQGEHSQALACNDLRRVGVEPPSVIVKPATTQPDTTQPFLPTTSPSPSGGTN